MEEKGNENTTVSQNYLARLLEINSALASQRDSQSLLQKIVDYSVVLLKLGSAAIYLLEGERLRLKAAYPPLPPDFPEEFRNSALKDHPRVEQAIVSEEFVLLADTHGAEQTPAERELNTLRNLRSLLFLPLIYKERRIGALVIASVGEVHAFSHEEIDAYRALANLTALQYEGIRSMEANQRTIANLENEFEKNARTERHLMESEARFRHLAENAQDLIYRIRLVPDKSFEYVNPAAKKITGYTPEEHYADPHLGYKLVHPEDRHLLEAAAVGKAELTQPPAMRWVRKDGRVIWIELRNVPIFDREGRPVAIEGIVRDITEQKEREQTIKESEDHYRALFENSPVSLWEEDYSAVKVHLDGLRAGGVMDLGAYLDAHPEEVWHCYSLVKVVDVNQASIELHQAASKEELMGNLTRVLSGDGSRNYKDHANMRDELVWLANGHTHGCWEAVNYKLTGEAMDVLVTYIITPRYQENWGRLIFAITDLSERKQAERLAQNLVKREEEEIARKYREAILSAVAFSAERLLGSSDWETEIETILGRLGEAAAASRTTLFQSMKNEAGEIITSWRFEWCAPNILPQINDPILQNYPLISGGFERWQKLLDKGEVIQGAVSSFPTSEREVLTSQGIQSILVIPIFAEERLWGHLGMEQNKGEHVWSIVEVDALVTAARMIGIAIERKNAESALRQTQQKLIVKEKLATLGQLAGGVGHELRNPLGVINNAAYILKMQLRGENEKASEYADLIAQQVQRSNKIISDLLNFAREPGAIPADVDVRELTARVLRGLAPPNGVSVRTIFAKELPMARADAQHVEQILANLVSNAYQAMPESGKLRVHASLKKGEVHISVQDSGVGITPENLGKVFIPLFTTKARGIGLGLATSQKLAEANGGRILVSSQPGRGSTFTLVLPAAGGAHGA